MRLYYVVSYLFKYKLSLSHTHSLILLSLFFIQNTVEKIVNEILPLFAETIAFVLIGSPKSTNANKYHVFSLYFIRRISSLIFVFLFVDKRDVFLCVCMCMCVIYDVVEKGDEEKLAIQPSHHYHLSFHLVNSDPESRIMAWNFHELQQSKLILIVLFEFIQNIKQKQHTQIERMREENVCFL
jgi:hypothetical protein